MSAFCGGGGVQFAAKFGADAPLFQRAGQIVLIPMMQPHKVYNTGRDDLVLLVACAPAWEASDVVWLETHEAKP